MTVRHLDALYPDRRIDVAAEQAVLMAHDRIVFQHPFYWYSTPPLMKQWLDEVLTYGWAFGAVSAQTEEAAPNGAPGTALRGKALWLVVTTGGQEDSYHPDSYNR